MEINPSTRNQKIILNYLFLLCFTTIVAFFVMGLIFVWTIVVPDTDAKASARIQLIAVQIAISIVLIWFIIFLPYLAWAVYFYNINLGRTNEEWEQINRRNLELGPTEQISPENPYRDETFGLPRGTIRGALAITLMVGALSLMILAIGHPTIIKENEFFHENFEFFKTAFLMMIAFYFGSKSLEYLRERWGQNEVVGAPSRRSGGGNTQEAMTDEDVSDDTPRTELPLPSSPTCAREKVNNAFDDDEAEARSNTAAKVQDENTDPLNLVMTDVHLIATADAVERDKPLTNTDIEQAAKDLGIEVAALKAVIAVESAGSGFLSDGRPKILFEGHIFWSQLEKNGKNPAELAAQYPELVYRSWTKKFYKGGIREYDRYNTALLIDADAAKKSTSWGMFQIMGFNCELCGFKATGDNPKPVDSFVQAMALNEQQQLRAFMEFCASKDLIKHLKSHDWQQFALLYNGKGYKQNQYDEKLEMNYTNFLKEYKTDIAIRLTREPSNEKQTQGILQIMESGQVVFECKTLELPWKGNQRNISCIPTGNYTVEKRFTQERGNHFHLLNVPGRSSILIHSGNYYSHTLGCILVGEKFSDLNKDGFVDIVSSRITLGKMNDILPRQFSIGIQDTGHA
jgi:hypothetical protein